MPGMEPPRCRDARFLSASTQAVSWCDLLCRCGSHGAPALCTALLPVPQDASATRLSPSDRISYASVTACKEREAMQRLPVEVPGQSCGAAAEDGRTRARTLKRVLAACRTCSGSPASLQKQSPHASTPRHQRCVCDCVVHRPICTGPGGHDICPDETARRRLSRPRRRTGVRVCTCRGAAAAPACGTLP